MILAVIDKQLIKKKGILAVSWEMKLAIKFVLISSEPCYIEKTAIKTVL